MAVSGEWANSERCKQEKDLGVLLCNNLKVSVQCQQACSKALWILGMINRTIIHRHTDILLKLYKSLMRPHLEYCIVAWSPHNKDKVMLEKVQRRFTRMIPSYQLLISYHICKDFKA